MRNLVTLDDVVEITLFSSDGILTPQEAFLYYYDPLRELVAINRSQELPQGWGDDALGRCTERGKEIKNRWILGIEEYISATVRTYGGEERHFSCRPRTNFSATGMVKLPSILHLDDDVGSHLILREARVHDPALLNTRFSDHAEGFRALQDLMLDFSYNTGGYDKASLDKDRLYPVSEPHLVDALERFYVSRPDMRMTPPLKTLDQDPEHLWYVRDYFPLLRDSSCEPKQLAAHMARAHSMGILGFLDEDFAHYALSDGGRIVNYDPDIQVVGISEPAHRFQVSLLKNMLMHREAETGVSFCEHTADAIIDRYEGLYEPLHYDFLQHLC